MIDLIKALIAAKAEFKPLKKSGYNPHFKSSFSTLEDIHNSTREPLAKHGLTLTHLAVSNELGAGAKCVLMHESGQTLSEELVIPLSRRDAHAVGSAISYARRYSSEAILGLSSAVDDDGNAATNQGGPQDVYTGTATQNKRVGELIKEHWQNKDDKDAKAKLLKMINGKTMDEVEQAVKNFAK